MPFFVDLVLGMLYDSSCIDKMNLLMERIFDMSEKTLVYREIYLYLRDRIFNGEFAPGCLLPSEYSLCSQFEASRETVRKALKLLENEGLVYSKEKVGYFVSAPNHSDFTLNYVEEKDGFRTEFYGVHILKPTDSVRRALSLKMGKRVIEFIQITRDSNDVPVACNVKYIPYEKTKPSVENEMRFTLMNPSLTFPPSFNYYSTIEVSAAGAPKEISTVLACRPGAPLLLVERMYIRQDGTKIGYSKQYSLKGFGRLYGIAGPRNTMED